MVRKRLGDYRPLYFDLGLRTILTVTWKFVGEGWECFKKWEWFLKVTPQMGGKPGKIRDPPTWDGIPYFTQFLVWKSPLSQISSHPPYQNQRMFSIKQNIIYKYKYPAKVVIFQIKKVYLFKM